jgi:hypothetical protein
MPKQVLRVNTSTSTSSPETISKKQNHLLFRGLGANNVARATSGCGGWHCKAWAPCKNRYTHRRCVARRLLLPQRLAGGRIVRMQKKVGHVLGAVMPNTSLKRSADGRPPGPGLWCAHIFTARALASCRRLPLSSNVRRHKAHPSRAYFVAHPSISSISWRRDGRERSSQRRL